MKTVFASNELAHVWAHQTQSHGRCRASMSFEGTAFYSYATIIARIMPCPEGKAYVIDKSSFSVSTRSHQSCARLAIPYDCPVFVVYQGQRGQRLDFTPQKLRDYYIASAIAKRDKTPSRYAHKRAEQWEAFGHQLGQAKRVCNLWRIGSARVDKLLAAYEEGKANVADTLNAYRLKKKEAQKRKEAKERKERVARIVSQAQQAAAEPEWPKSFAECQRVEKLAEDIPADLLAVLRAKCEAFKASALSRWDAGERLFGFPSEPVRFRKVGDNMQTNKGASVPLADAERAFRFALAVKQAGRDWRKNGERCPVGSYELDSVTASGIVAGCHRVNWPEVERFASLMGW